MASLRSLTLLCVCCLALSGSAGAREPVGREAVRRALAAVDHWLAASQYASAWHNELRTADLRRELSRSGPPDLDVLEKVMQRVTEHSLTLKSQRIAALQRALQGWLAFESLPDGRYLASVASSILQTTDNRRLAVPPLISTVSARSVRSPSGELRAHLIALAVMLSEYARHPSSELAASIDRQLGWLAATGKADALIEAIRQYYGAPNVWIDVSEDLLDDPIAGNVDRLEAVNDTILGTPLSGRGRLRAVSDLKVEPDSDRAILRITVQGDVHTQTVGRSGPARIHSIAITSFRAHKLLYLEPTGLRAMPTVCMAETRTVDSGVSATTGGLRGRIVRRVGARRWADSREAADQEGARHVEEKVRAEVDRKADELARRLHHLAIAPMLALAKVPSGSYRTQVRFCTEDRVLRIGVVHGCLGAPPGRPAFDKERLFAVRLHSSLAGHQTPPTRSGAIAFVPASALALLSPSNWPSARGGAWLATTRKLLDLDATFTSPSVATIVADWIPWNELRWNWLDGLLRPRWTSEGIVLRDGSWGTVLPMGLATDWVSLEWRPFTRGQLSARPTAMVK